MTGHHVAWVLVGAGLLTIAACSDDETGGGGGAAPTTSTTTTTSWVTTSSTTTSSTTSTTCDIDLTLSMGSSQECNDCVAEQCCADALAFEATPNGDTYQALYDCASSSSCLSACRFSVCGGPWTFLLGQQCTECITETCCVALEDCIADVECGTCGGTGAFTVDPCCANERYLAYDTCLFVSCGAACAPLLWDRESCNAGGSGGAGGQGGSGGAGGAG